jgi:hypothetical protein
MRRLFGNLMVCGILTIFASPAYAERAGDDETTVAAPVGVQRLPGGGVRDEAAMVIIGTALIGLAAAVRKAA